MIAKLKESVEAAGEVLSDAEQRRLANLIDAYATHHRERDDMPFTEAELADLHAMLDEPFKLADPKRVEALFAKYGA